MTRFYLKKRSILRSSKDIEILFDQGLVFKSRSFDVFFRCSEDCKVLFAASKKIRKHALKSRCKRLLRELYRRQQAKVHRPMHLALIAKEPILLANPDQLDVEFEVFLASAQ
ncbi:MAG: ribonuclease P protein component [Deferribacteres bacterium]|nr:ribonuclease P protein component [Deferribacteres bacterium]